MIIEMNQTHVDEVVAVHMKVLPDTFNVSIGPEYLKRLYQIVLEERESARGWVYSTEGHVQGFITVCLDMKRIDSLIRRKIGFRFLLNILFQVCRDVHNLVELYERRALSRLLTRNYGELYPSILTMGITSACRGKGIGRTLLGTSEVFYREKHVPKYYVDTIARNHRAVRFYEHNGFSKIGEFKGNVILEKVVNP
jgi:GNAT superfamily N-acetyltransferase